ncbi:MAG: N-acetylmuramoyl-L-alanine amidase [Clostridium sp.]
MRKIVSIAIVGIALISGIQDGGYAEAVEKTKQIETEYKVNDDVSNIIKKMERNKALKIKEDINADDSNLEISMDDYLKVKESKNIKEENIQSKKATTTPNGVVINETNFKWAEKLDLTNMPKKIIMHHIEASRPGSTIPVTDIHNWHLANGWSGIGYHFYVTKTGKVYRGRPEEAIGAHASKNNLDTLGIAVEGRYQSESMPKAQKDAVIKLGQYLRGKYGIKDIFKHKDVNSTDCPGKNYPFTEIRNSISSYGLGKFNKVVYQTHIQDKGWQDFKTDSQTSGSVGQAKRLEGIKIKTNGFLPGAKLRYRTHVESHGWQGWKSEGQLSGTSGEGKRLEAIEIVLDNAPGYEVEYRTHVQDIGWQGWKRQGEMAGTSGQSKRLEAIEIRIVKEKPLNVEYVTHIESKGWQNWVKDGQLAGSIGQAKRLEGIKIKVNNLPSNANLKYRTHVQDIGWQGWKNNGEFAGTEGQAKRLEAIEIKLENAPKYRIEYRVHIQDIGWQGWKKNGELAGTTGKEKRLEAIEIRVVKN